MNSVNWLKKTQLLSEASVSYYSEERQRALAYVCLISIHVVPSVKQKPPV